MLVRHGLRSIALPDRPARRTWAPHRSQRRRPHRRARRPSGRFWWQPLLTLAPLPPIGIRLDQTGIDRKGFAADQTLSDAALQDRLKDASQEIALAETAMPILGEGGMIGDIAVEPEPAEPPVGQIEVDLFAETPLGADTEAVPDDEHADHQLGINRWPSQRAVERRELAAQFRQVDKAVDRPQQMISRHMSIEREVVEQHTLFDLPWSHHRLSSCLSTGLNQWTFTVSTSALFNKIGPERTSL